MLKKSLLSLAVAASLGVTGCNISSTSGNADADSVRPDAIADGTLGVQPIFDPANGTLPNGIDLLFAAQASATVPDANKDGTADSGTTDSSDGQPTYEANAITNALDDLPGGISTVAPIDFRFNGALDPDSVVVGTTVYLVRLPNAADAQAGTVTVPAGVDVDQLDLASIAALYAVDDPTTNVVATVGLQPADSDYQATVVSIDGGTNNMIRVTPTKPLDAAAKYIVVLTTDITGADGGKITPSSNYSYVTDTPEDQLWNPAFAGVKSSIAGWELLSTTILGAMGEEVAADDIALTSAFTTIDPHTVLKSMAYPGYWLPNVITSEAVAEAVLTSGGIDFSAMDEATKIATAIGVGNSAITTTALSPVVPYEHPRDRETAVITGLDVQGDGSVLVNQVPAVAISGSLSGKVLISQGAIELPHYTTLLTETDEPQHQWTANIAVGAVLDGALGQDPGTTPPSDLNGDKNVTYRFPFAQEQFRGKDEDENSIPFVAPMIMVEPTTTAKAGAMAALGAVDSSCVKPGAGWQTIIFQHGITVDRGATLAMAAQLAENTCHAVIAIDLPHHGIAPVASDRNGADVDNSRVGLSVDAPTSMFAAAKAVLAAPTTASIFDNLTERHEGVALTSANATAPMTYGSLSAGTAFGASGDFFIRLDNFQRTSDNMKQAVMDLLNLNASIADMDIDGDSAADLDETNVHFVGHSLGAIVGATFVAVNNDATVLAGNTNLNQIKSAVLATPGGSLPKLLENSVSFKAQLLPSLEGVNPSLIQGNSALEQYMAIFQATVDTADPVNFVGSLATGGDSATNTMIIEMVGGGAVSDADDAADNLPTSIEALGAYPSDLVVPNNAVGGTLADGSVRVETAQTPMAGTDKLVELIDAEHIAATAAETHPVMKYQEGTHGTFSSADALAAFGEMVSQVATFIATDGANVTVTNSAVLTAPAQ